MINEYRGEVKCEYKVDIPRSSYVGKINIDFENNINIEVGKYNFSLNSKYGHPQLSENIYQRNLEELKFSIKVTNEWISLDDRDLISTKKIPICYAEGSRDVVNIKSKLKLNNGKYNGKCTLNRSKFNKLK